MFKSNYNTEKFPDTGELNTMPSETVPDGALSVREILRRFTTNTLLPIAKTPYYDEEANYDSFDVTANPAYDLADYTADINDIQHRKRLLQTMQDNSMQSAPTPSPSTEKASEPKSADEKQ